MIKTRIQVTSEKARAVYEVEGVPALIYQLCQVHGLSIREFASIFEISKGHAENILKHKTFPSLTEALKICRYFEVTVEELFGWRVDDTGKRRPLLVEDPRTGKVVRLNRDSDIKDSMDLAAAARGE